MLISSLCKSSASWILLLSYALLDTHLCTLPVAFSNVSPLKNWSFLWTDHVRLHQKLSPAYQSLIALIAPHSSHHQTLLPCMLHASFRRAGNIQQFTDSLHVLVIYIYQHCVCSSTFLRFLYLELAVEGTCTHICTGLYATGQKKEYLLLHL